MKILKKGGVVEKRGRRKRNPCPMRLWCWSEIQDRMPQVSINTRSCGKMKKCSF
jgi:hypothetical protein